MSTAPSGLTFVNNEAASRFEVQVADQMAIAEYRRRDGLIIFTHTEVPEALRGLGIANQLIAFALEYARAQGLAITPRCPFVAAYIQRHPEYQPLVSWP